MGRWLWFDCYDDDDVNDDIDDSNGNHEIVEMMIGMILMEFLLKLNEIMKSIAAVYISIFLSMCNRGSLVQKQ